jgi:hypothetical protein
MKILLHTKTGEGTVVVEEGDWVTLAHMGERIDPSLDRRVGPDLKVKWRIPKSGGYSWAVLDGKGRVMYYDPPRACQTGDEYAVSFEKGVGG